MADLNPLKITDKSHLPTRALRCILQALTQTENPSQSHSKMLTSQQIIVFFFPAAAFCIPICMSTGWSLNYWALYFAKF